MRRRRRRVKLRWILAAAATAAAVLLIVALWPGTDPDVAKQQSFARGQAYVAQGKIAEAIIEFRTALTHDPTFGEARFALAEAYDRSGELAKAYPEYLRAADALPDNAAAQLKAGAFLLGAEQYALAEERARRVLDRDPRNVAARVLLGNALAEQQRFDAGLTQLEEAIALDPSESALYANLGAWQTQRRNMAAAEASFRKAIEANPASADAHLSLAHLLWRGGRTSDAEASIQEALRIEPANPVATLALAELYIVTGRLPQAEPLVLKLAAGSSNVRDQLRVADYYVLAGRLADAKTWLTRASADPVNGAPLAAPRLASIELSSGRPAEAMKVLEAVLARYPHDAAALLTKARFLQLQGKDDEAYAVVRTAVEANPKSPAAHYALGTMQHRRNEIAAAIQSFTEVIRLAPLAAPARRRLADLRLLEGEADAAVTFAQDALRSNERDGASKLTLVRSLVSAGRLSEAQQHLKTLAAESPTSADVRTQLGLVALMQDRRADARREFTLALDADPDAPQPLAGLVHLDMRERKLPAARARLDTALARTPKSVPHLMMAAVVAKAAGDVAGAERMLRRVLDTDARNTQAYLVLGQLYVANRRLHDARGAFGKVLEHDPTSLQARTMLAMLYQLEGRTAEAKKAYEAILQSDPAATLAANNLAFLYAESSENLDTALQLAQKAKERAPDDAEINDTLGWVYVKKDLAASAVPLLQQSVARDPANAMFRYHLGIAYLRSGDAVKGRESLEAAVRIDPSFPAVDDARRALAAAAARTR